LRLSALPVAHSAGLHVRRGGTAKHCHQALGRSDTGKNVACWAAFCATIHIKLRYLTPIFGAAAAAVAISAASIASAALNTPTPHTPQQSCTGSAGATVSQSPGNVQISDSPLLPCGSVSVTSAPSDPKPVCGVTEMVWARP